MNVFGQICVNMIVHMFTHVFANILEYMCINRFAHMFGIEPPPMLCQTKRRVA